MSETMTAAHDRVAEDKEFKDRLARQRRSFQAALPLYLAVPAAIAALIHAGGHPVQWGLAAAGAAGWWLALVLRAPAALLGRKLPPAALNRLVVGASGPLEEGVRLAAVLWLVPGFSGALWLGWGWASIEVLFTIANGLVLLRLLDRDDDNSRQVRAILEARGTFSDAAPWLGVIERILASAVHVGFTLVVAAAPALALVTAPVHSALNLAVNHLSRRMVLFLALLALAAAVVLGAGLALFAAGR